MIIRSHPAAKAAATAGTFLLSAVLLTGCAGEKHTFNGAEVAKLDKTIEALDTKWAEHRANGVAATVSDDSRCFVQTGTEGVLAETAICGPVRYLGQDDTGWDSVPFAASPEGADKMVLSDGGGFSANAKPNANTSLYRTDGKKPVENPSLDEPDTEAAESAKALWDLTGTASTGSSAVEVKTPDGTLSITGARISDRVGGASNRLKAGDNHKFGSVTVSFSGSGGETYGTADPEVKTGLAFTSGGKDYPIGKVKTGSVAMAVPGDGSDLALAVTYDGLTQKVTLADSKLHTTATALYDDKATLFEAKTAPETKIFGKHGEPGFFAEIRPLPVKAERLAYDPAMGWAPKNKAWLKVTGIVTGAEPRFVGGGVSSSYAAKMTATAATAANVSGEKFSVDAAKIINDKSSGGWYTTTGGFTVFFEVPASGTEFNVSYDINTGGPKSKDQDEAAPPTASFDYPVPATEVSFSK